MLIYYSTAETREPIVKLIQTHFGEISQIWLFGSNNYNPLEVPI